MTPITAHPQYLQAKKAIHDLAAALAKVDARRTEIQDALPRPSRDRDAAQIEAALTFARTGEVCSAADSPRALNEEFHLLGEQRDALLKGIALQSTALATTAQGISMAIRPDLLPAHKKLAARMVTHLQGIADALSLEAEMLREIDAAGYDAGFPEYLAWPLVQDDNLLQRRLAELRRYVA